MTFGYSQYSECIHAAVRYEEHERSFLTYGQDEMLCSIMLGEMYVGLDVCADGTTICSISGLCPKAMWKFADIVYPAGEPGELKVAADDLVMGCGYRYSDVWNVFYDPKNKVVLFKNCTVHSIIANECVYIKFLDNATALLVGERLAELYIKDISA